MTKTIAFVSAIALAAGLTAAGANAAPTHQLASKAQLAREHARAVKAGDTANDPNNSASSDALNQQQLAKAQALPGADVQPGSINSGATNTSAVDANTGMSNDSNMAPAPMNNGSATNATPDQSNTMPPATPPVQGTTPDSQNTPQATPSTPQGGTTDTNPSSPQ